MQKTNENQHLLIELKKYIVSKFILLLLVASIAERILVSLFEQFIFPFLNTFFVDNGIEIKYSNRGMLLGVCFYLILILIKCVAQILPFGINRPVEFIFSFLSERFFHTDRDLFVFEQDYSAGMDFLMHIAVISIILILIVIALLPYVITILIFSKLISVRVRKQETEIEHERNLFLADIAHDLKTPLTSIVGYSQALKDHLVDEPRQQEQYLDYIYQKSVKMNDMMVVLFEYLKLNSSGFSLQKKRIDLCELARECGAGLYLDFENKGIEFSTDIPEKPVYIQADFLQMTRAVENLLQNALRHNQKDAKVLLELKQEDEIIIKIWDNGCKIQKEISNHIFEPFALGDSSRNSKNGSGLGLSISSKIISMHDGHLILDQSGTEIYTKAFVISLK